VIPAMIMLYVGVAILSVMLGRLCTDAEEADVA
jgi:hypothetical protein